MDQESPRHPWVNDLAIPIADVEFILSGWSGSGTLYAALANVGEDGSLDREWDEKSLKSRANRILIEHLCDDVLRWPETAQEWLPHLPVSTGSSTCVTQAPRGRVDWRETARRFGWPARSFVTRQRHREVSDVTITTLAWTAGALENAINDSRSLGTGEHVHPGIELRVNAVQEALAHTSLPDELPRPDRHDLEALGSSGAPWSAVGAVTRWIIRAEADPTWFATQLLAPDYEFRWRLFHLAVLGHVLRLLRGHGARIQWLSPMGMGSRGPDFLATTYDGEQIDIWFEAAGAHDYYDRPHPSLYRRVVRPIKGPDAAIGADVALFIPGRRQALLLECKFSTASSYIGRSGFHQAASYALNAAEHWPTVWSYVVGPEEVIAGTSCVPLPEVGESSKIGVTSIPRLNEVIRGFLDVSSPGQSTE